jgi:hypothetical protein
MERINSLWPQQSDLYHSRNQRNKYQYEQHRQLSILSIKQQFCLTKHLDIGWHHAPGGIICIICIYLLTQSQSCSQCLCLCLTWRGRYIIRSATFIASTSLLSDDKRTFPTLKKNVGGRTPCLVMWWWWNAQWFERTRVFDPTWWLGGGPNGSHYPGTSSPVRCTHCAAHQSIQHSTLWLESVQHTMCITPPLDSKVFSKRTSQPQTISKAQSFNEASDKIPQLHQQESWIMLHMVHTSKPTPIKDRGDSPP